MASVGVVIELIRMRWNNGGGWLGASRSRVGSSRIRSPRIRAAGIGSSRIWLGGGGWEGRRPIRGDDCPLGQGQQASQNDVKRPALSPTENSGLGQNGVDSDEQKESRAAQAADQDIAIHRGPPFDSPRRRTTSQT